MSIACVCHPWRLRLSSTSGWYIMCVANALSVCCFYVHASRVSSKDCHVNEAAQFENNVYCKRCWEKGRYSKKQVATTQNFNADKPKAAVSSRFANLGGGGNKCY